jgi:hypothetical protein
VKRKNSLLTVTVALAAVLAVAGPACAQMHSSELPPLTLEGPYPRVSEAVAGTLGFPDHRHEYHGGGWTPAVGADGQTYGPGSLCRLNAPVPRPGLVIEPASKSYGPWVLRHNPGYGDCDMLPCVELLEVARVRMQDLLGFAPHDTLEIVNPNSTPHYMELAGYGVWRMYRLEGDRAVIEPFAVLLARTLDGHATVMLGCDWILRQNLAKQPLPAWLHQGLVEYLGEDGIHLADFMTEFRANGPVTMGPEQINAILAAGVDADQAKDREQFRKACYNAFLMTWQLVEYEGGIVALRDFLGQAAAGIPLDQAARSVYGLDMATLTSMLDPLASGEPAAGRVFNAAPHKQP